MSTQGLFKNTATVSGNEFDPNLSNNTSSVEIEVFDRISELACIIVPKIFSSCQSRHCFSNIKFELPNRGLSLVRIQLGRGELTNQTLTPLANRPNYARIIYDVTIPITLIFKKLDGSEFSLFESLPITHHDIVLYSPKSASEISFSLCIETRSELTSPAIIEGASLILSVGVFMKTFLAMPVQLQVEAFGYCHFYENAFPRFYARGTRFVLSCYLHKSWNKSFQKSS